MSSGSVSAGAALPAGTVTLLLADIEGSTRLWQDHEADMPAAIAALDALVDDAVAAYHGVRPVEQGEGDSFVVAFALASDAVACALALQRATTDGLIRLRIGLHTGEVQRRNEGNYIGPAINRTARIRDAGHGGQTLLSQTTTDIVRDQLPDGADVVDLGEQHLRDLARPERLFQLTHPELRREFPGLRGKATVQTNLPAPVSSFVGRVEVVAELDALLNDNRVVTLTGAGGCGKTRLALHMAARRTGQYDGVWLVDFSPVNDADALTTVVADAIGATTQTGVRERDAVVGVLRDLTALLVFDNCEHVIAGCADLADFLVQACPALTILATSREPVGLVGEVTYRVPSLAEDDAVALFADRASRANARFGLDDANAPVVAEICQRLDGIPLAIELAAARLRVLTATQIRDGLHDRFRLLTGGARTAVQRQQTLQASVDWSYALLLEPERVLLHRLSVFAGGFTIDAAQSVGASADVETHHVLDLLSQLVDKSLVILDESTDRFRLLETIRQYAAAKLVESGDADAARQAHFDFYFARARRGFETIDAFNARIDADYDNLRRALQWAEGRREPDALVRLAGRLFSYWTLGRRVAEGARWLELAVDRTSDPALRVRILGHHALLQMMVNGAASAEAPAREAVALSRQIGTPGSLAWSLIELGNVLANLGVLDEAERSLQEAVAIAAEQGDAGSEAFALFQIGRQLSTTEPQRARGFLDRAIDAARRGGAEYVERMSVACLGFAAWCAGDVADGLRLIGDGRDALHDSGDRWFLGAVLGQHAVMLHFVGCPAEADVALAELRAIDAVMPGVMTDTLSMATGTRAWIEARWSDAIEAFTVGRDLTASMNLVPFLVALTMTGDIETAAAQLDQVHAMDTAVTARTLALADAVVAHASGAAARAEEQLHVVLGEGLAMPHEPALALLALLLLARLAADDGAHEFATRVLAGATAQAEAVGFATSAGWWQAHAEPAHAAALAGLGAERFDEVWRQGAALSPDELRAYVRRGRGERKRATSGWASLTPTETQVVGLVVEGLTNPLIAEKLFMSVATVKSHLTHVYAKLGIASRAELVAAALQRSR